MIDQKINYSTLLCFWLLLLAGGCTNPAPADGLTIAVASSIRFAAEVLADDYTRTTGTPVTLISGSSGKLTAQIMQGAPYHFFLSANESYPESLYERGLTVGSVEVFAFGSLVLWATDTLISDGPDLLSEPAIEKIAIANPLTAPYGVAAMEVLHRISLDSIVANKLVYGESITQVNQFVASGAAQIGFTALSVVLAPRINPSGQPYFLINDSLHSPIPQTATVIRCADEKIEAKAMAFREYLNSPSGQRILRQFGYRMRR